MVSKSGIRSTYTQSLEEDLCDTCCSDTEDNRSVRTWTTDQDAPDGARNMVHSEAWGMAPDGMINNVSMGYSQGIPCVPMPVAMGYMPMSMCFVAMPMSPNTMPIVETRFASENTCSVDASILQERFTIFEAAEKWKQDRAMLSEQSPVPPPKQWQSPCAPGASQADPRIESPKPSSTGQLPAYTGHGESRQPGQLPAHTGHGETRQPGQLPAYTGHGETRQPPQQSGSGNTTVILRNLPTGCTRDVLLELLDDQGFFGKYDFVHLPIDFQTEVGLGYAIVNFVSHSVAMCVHDAFQTRRLNPCDPNDQVCEVAWNNPYQGLASHIDRYRNSPLMHPRVPETYRPVLFKNGVRIAFPEPTARIKAPRIRHQRG